MSLLAEVQTTLDYLSKVTFRSFEFGPLKGQVGIQHLCRTQNIAWMSASILRAAGASLYPSLTERHISVFGNKNYELTEPFSNKFVFLVDESRSMLNTRLDAATVEQLRDLSEGIFLSVGIGWKECERDPHELKQKYIEKVKEDKNLVIYERDAQDFMDASAISSVIQSIITDKFTSSLKFDIRSNLGTYKCFLTGKIEDIAQIFDLITVDVIKSKKQGLIPTPVNPIR